MDDLDGLVTGEFIFRVPVWTVAYLTPDRMITIAGVPTALDSQGEWAFGIFTDNDQADRYRNVCNTGREVFRVFSIDDPQSLEFWLDLVETKGITHVAFDFTDDIARGQRSGRFETVAEVRRLARTMRPVQ